MPYLSGVLTGILVTILAVYLIDHVGPQPDAQDIVNWNVVAEKLGSASEEVRQEVLARRPRHPRPGAYGESRRLVSSRRRANSLAIKGGMP